MEYTRKIIIEKLTNEGTYNARGKKYESASIDKICKKLGIQGAKKPYTYYDKKTGQEKTSLEWVYSEEDTAKIIDHCRRKPKEPRKPAEKKERKNTKNTIIYNYNKLATKVEQLKTENKILRKQVEDSKREYEGHIIRLVNEIEEVYDGIYTKLAGLEKKLDEKKKPWWRK